MIGPDPEQEWRDQPDPEKEWKDWRSGEFAGLPCVAFADFTGKRGERGGLPTAGTRAWRLEPGHNGDDDESAGVYLAGFMNTVDPTQIRAIVFLSWWNFDHGPRAMIQALAANADRFPALRAIRVGDVGPERCELAWIQQGDVTPLLEAFPALERLEVQGGNDLVLRPVRHERLKVLRMESMGLPGGVVRGIGESDLPALEKLELWLGAEHCGWDGTVADLAGILSGDRLPALRDLGLMNCEIQDEVALAVASAPVVPRLERLDLSMSTLDDEGAEALLSGQPLTHLRELNLSHHFLTDSMMGRFHDVFAGTGVEVNLSDQNKDEGFRYIELVE